MFIDFFVIYEPIWDGSFTVVKKMILRWSHKDLISEGIVFIRDIKIPSSVTKTGVFMHFLVIMFRSYSLRSVSKLPITRLAI